MFYVEAFIELGSCRLNGMSLGAIPFTSIVEYHRIFDVGDLEDFLYLIRKMDDVLLSLESKRMKKEMNSGSGKSDTKNNNSV